MKKYLLFLVAIAFCFSVQAQKNVIKLGLGSALQSDINLKYERFFAEHHSFQVAFTYDTPEDLDLTLFTADPAADIDAGRLAGFVVLPEYRYYFTDKDAPRGFYLGAYGRFRTRTLTTEDDFGTDISVTSKINLRNFGGGIGCGAQFMIKDAFVIDWYIAGFGYNRFSAKVNLRPTDPADFEELRAEVIKGIDDYELPDDTAGSDQIEFDQLLMEFRDQVEAIDASEAEINTPRIPFGLLDIRTGLSIGYAF